MKLWKTLFPAAEPVDETRKYPLNLRDPLEEGPAPQMTGAEMALLADFEAQPGLFTITPWSEDLCKVGIAPGEGLMSHDCVQVRWKKHGLAIIAGEAPHYAVPRVVRNATWGFVHYARWGDFWFHPEFARILHQTALRRLANELQQHVKARRAKALDQLSAALSA